MTKKVIHLRHYEEIVASRIRFSCKYGLFSISPCSIYYRSNRYPYKAIQGIKASGLSLFTRSFKSQRETIHSGTQIGFYCKAAPRSNRGTKVPCQEVEYSNKCTIREYHRYLPENKEKGWVKALCRKKFCSSTILTVWHQRNLSMYISFLFQIIHQTRKSQIRITYLFQNKKNYPYANSSHLCPCFI